MAPSARPLPNENVTRIQTVCDNVHLLTEKPLSTTVQSITTFSNGCLGSHNDEERSEMRYVMRIAGPRESSNF